MFLIYHHPSQPTWRGFLGRSCNAAYMSLMILIDGNLTQFMLGNKMYRYMYFVLAGEYIYCLEKGLVVISPGDRCVESSYYIRYSTRWDECRVYACKSKDLLENYMYMYAHRPVDSTCTCTYRHSYIHLSINTSSLQRLCWRLDILSDPNSLS